jgi:hypothetical protein
VKFPYYIILMLYLASGLIGTDGTDGTDRTDAEFPIPRRPRTRIWKRRHQKTAITGGARAVARSSKIVGPPVYDNFDIHVHITQDFLLIQLVTSLQKLKVTSSRVSTWKKR